MSSPLFAIESFPGALSKTENAPLLTGILRGIEKESLRVEASGALALSAHPKALGAALTHPQITTDFSEALLEFITPPSHSMSVLMEQLKAIHTYTYRNLGDEMLWVNSMPCSVGESNSIPVAQYGTSHRGKMKTVYRVGLGHRYGRVMQTVAGVHYNFSLPRAFWAFLHQQEGSTEELKDFIDARYFGLIRNFRRNYWLLLYLFGASPAMCRSFTRGRGHNLQAWDEDGHTLYLPYATSLRMGDLGYQSSAQESLFVCYNARQSYVNTLGQAIFTPYAPYDEMGLYGDDGERIQLNSSLLQIENEFYSAIRPKRTAQAGETALTALCQRGVEYIEVRCLDLDPFSPEGVTEEQIQFLDTFLMYCLLKDSPLCDKNEFTRITKNHKSVVTDGRNPSLELELPSGGTQPLREWGQQLLQALGPVAELLDGAHGTEETAGVGSYCQALEAQKAKMENADLTPSAQVLQRLKSESLSFAQWGRKQSERFKAQVMAAASPVEQQHRLQKMAEQSLLKQSQEEAQNAEEEAKTGFEHYLNAYYAQYKICCESR